MRDEWPPPPPTQTARSEPSASKPRSGRRRGSAGTANGRAEAVGLAGDSAPSCDAPPGCEDVRRPGSLSERGPAVLPRCARGGDEVSPQSWGTGTFAGALSPAPKRP